MKGAILKCSAKELLESGVETMANHLIGGLVSLGFSAENATRRSYVDSLTWVQTSFTELAAVLPEVLNWWLFFEFSLPRRQKRFDLVILAGDRIVVAEFKTGETESRRAALLQAEDYAMDLRDFHETSAGRLIVPVVVCNTPGVRQIQADIGWERSQVSAASLVASEELASFLHDVICLNHGFDRTPIDPLEWEIGEYYPVPPILEAALHLYQDHQVVDIASCAAGSDNLTRTVDTIREIALSAAKDRQRVICFVTGVPGSGKTLAGLSSVHSNSDATGHLPAATFLTGNSPLVKVLREALIRDVCGRKEISRKEAEGLIRTFVENMHAFMQQHAPGESDKPPVNRIIVFDEAQRAWDRDQMRRKKKVERSEPELLLEIMGKHEDAVIIALVGGGQEIHQGEAGLKGWGEALAGDSRWKVFASPQVIRGESSGCGSSLLEAASTGGPEIFEKEDLHLAVPRRTIRGRHWNEWVEEFLKGNLEKAREISQLLEGFDVRVTRDLDAARVWLRSRSKGTRRYGLVSSSENLRARPFGIETSSGFRSGINWPYWFLNNQEDVRSSYALEVAATEFECQGLELGEAGLCWGGDFLFNPAERTWRFSKFTGNSWKGVKKREIEQFIMSKYRVLLTRARTGLVIWIPAPDKPDARMDPQAFDHLFDAIRAAGISPLSE